MAARKYFDQLPPSSVGKYERQPKPEHVKMREDMKRHPELWTELCQKDSTSAAARFARFIRENRLVAFREGRWEAKTQGMKVYARYMGE